MNLEENAQGQPVNGTGEALSDYDKFQLLCVHLFTDGKGKEFLKYFNDLMIYHPIVDLEKTPYHAYYQDGFFSIFREINQAISKFNHRQKTKPKEVIHA